MVSNEKVLETVSSGIFPLKLLKANIRDCSSRSVKAFRTELLVNSLDLGVLTPDYYSSTAIKSGQAVALCERVFAHIAFKIRALKAHKSRIEWISCVCPLELLKSPDLSDIIKKYFPDDEDRAMLCLEFSDLILFEDPSSLEKVFYNLKLLGVRTMVSGVGSERCPLMHLLSFHFDFVLLDDSIARLVKKEETIPAAEGIVHLAASSKSSVIATNVESDGQASQWYKAGCDAYIKIEDPEDLIEQFELEEFS